MMRINLRQVAIAAALGSAALLAGCGGPKDAPVNEAANAGEFVETSNAMDMNLVEPVATPSATPTAATTGNTTTSEFSSESQTYDDAAATGMTSKLPEDNGTQPAQH
ncbi:hypothetical protein [Sphingomonas sp.]|uniref:hypothetical protein n=1 Tax=Sphingomonas sp. TaxID=28214 RepID=UPI001B0828D7|nr:hypothetical protein [Sphingomonas sp.]MBO9712269.1 hypothetical protein [Sphingomonas sp.]